MAFGKALELGLGRTRFFHFRDEIRVSRLPWRGAYLAPRDRTNLQFTLQLHSSDYRIAESPGQMRKFGRELKAAAYGLSCRE